jgi:hypothetical protein
MLSFRKTTITHSYLDIHYCIHMYYLVQLRGDYLHIHGLSGSFK